MKEKYNNEPDTNSNQNWQPIQTQLRLKSTVEIRNFEMLQTQIRQSKDQTMLHDILQHIQIHLDSSNQNIEYKFMCKSRNMLCFFARTFYSRSG